MVFLGLSTVESTSKSRQMDVASETRILRLSRVQLGSAGALVVLGVLGTAGSAQAMVRRGDQCEAVNRLQVALGDRGYDLGKVDGKFGGRTEAAVRRFQQQQNLLPDGIVGPATAQAMGMAPEFSCSFVAAQSVQKPVALVHAEPNGEFAVATNGGALQVRKEPAGAVVGALKDGDRVTIIETADGWARLSSGAWVSRAWLRVGAKAATPSPAKIVQPSASETVAQAVPGQVMQLPSPSPATSRLRGSAESKVVAASMKTGKIAVSLPPVQPVAPVPEAVVVPEIAAPEVTNPEVTNPEVVDPVVVSETAVIQAVMEPGFEVATTPARRSANSVTVNPTRLDLEPNRPRFRTLLAAAASDSIVLPSATAPESTDLNVAESPRVVDPAAALSPGQWTSGQWTSGQLSSGPLTSRKDAVEVAPSVSLAESPMVKAPVAKTLPVAEQSVAEAGILPPEAGEPPVVAVRSASQSMEVATYGDRLLIREQPGGQIIGSIPNGMTITTVAEQDGWHELETGGWVLARWLRN